MPSKVSIGTLSSQVRQLCSRARNLGLHSAPMLLRRTLAAWLWMVFGTFGLGTLILLSVPFDPTGIRRWRFVQRWATGLSDIMGLERLEVCGQEQIQDASGKLLMMNHTSGIDIMAIIRASDRPIAFLAKRGLFLVPFFGWYMSAARMVSIDRRNREHAVASLERAGDRIAAGETLMIFPEGTRSRTGRILPFKKGGFILAHQRGIPIQLMAIAGAREIHEKGFLVRGRGAVVMMVGEVLEPSRFDDVDTLIAYARGRMARCAGRARRRLELLGGDV